MVNKKFKTVRKKIEESLKGITLEYKPPEEKRYGVFPEFETGTNLQIHDFCPETGCNVFHADDMAEILYNLREPFELKSIMDRGRDHACHIVVRKVHVLAVSASGYGVGEGITFSKKFPEELKFEILRDMALKTIEGSKEYYGEYTKKLNKHARKQVNKYNALRGTIYEYVCNIKTLKEVAELYHLLYSNNFYKKLKPKDYKRNPEWKNRAQSVQQEYEKLLKTQVHNIFVEHLKKIEMEELKKHGRKSS